MKHHKPALTSRLLLLGALLVAMALPLACDDDDDDTSASGTPTPFPTSSPGPNCTYTQLTVGANISSTTGPAPAGQSDYCTSAYRFVPTSTGSYRIALEFNKPDDIDLELYQACSNGNLNQKVADGVSENVSDPLERYVIQQSLNAGTTYYICVENKLFTSAQFNLRIN